MRRALTILYSLFLVSSLLVLFSCASSSSPIETPMEIIEIQDTTPEVPQFDDVTLDVVFTSDIQGNILPYDFVSNSEKEYSLMNISTYISTLREQQKDLLLLDNGNVLQGDPVVDYFTFFDRSSEHIVSQAYKLMGYDASAVGQLDIQAGEEVFLDILEDSDHQYLCANIVYENDDVPVIDPYTIIQKGELNIAIIALSSPDLALYLPDGIKYIDQVSAASQWVAYITEHEQVNAIIALVQSDDPQRIAQQVEGLDVIFSKGDSAEVTSASGKTVPILTALPSAESVSHAQFTFSYDEIANKYVIRSIENEHVMMDDFVFDADTIDILSQQTERVMEWVFSNVGELEEDLTFKEALFEDSASVDILHYLQLKQTHADISMRSPLSIEATLEGGEVYVQDILSLFFDTSHTCVVALTGEQIYQMMEFSYGSWFNKMSSLQDELINLKKDEVSGEYLLANSSETYFSFANVQYTVDITKDKGERITIKGMNDGSPFMMDETYTVALDSRTLTEEAEILSATGLSSQQLHERIVSCSSVPFQYYLLKEFMVQGYIKISSDSNWKVIPDVWFQRGFKNSYPKLFREQL